MCRSGWPVILGLPDSIDYSAIISKNCLAQDVVYDSLFFGGLFEYRDKAESAGNANGAVRPGYPSIGFTTGKGQACIWQSMPF
jgi:hypothetical protein